MRDCNMYVFLYKQTDKSVKRIYSIILVTPIYYLENDLPSGF